MNFILTPLKLAAGLFGIFWMFFAGIAYVVWLPAGWPNYEVKCCVFVSFSLHAPYAGALKAADLKLAAYKKAEQDAEAHAKVVEAKDAQINASVTQHDQQAQAVIVTRWRTQSREVQTYVTPQVDTRFPVPWSVVRVFNAGAAGVDLSAVPLPPGAADDAASPVTASQLSTGLLGNDKTCFANAQQLIDLQSWAQQVSAVH